MPVEQRLGRQEVGHEAAQRIDDQADHPDGDHQRDPDQKAGNEEFFEHGAQPCQVDDEVGAAGGGAAAGAAAAPLSPDGLAASDDAVESGDEAGLAAAPLFEPLPGNP